MRTYARVTNGEVVELLSTDQDIATNFPKDFVAMLVDVTDVNPAPAQGWTAVKKKSKWSFQSPAQDVRVKTPEEVQATRLAAYRQESDHLKLEAEFDAISSGKQPDYAAWLAKVEEIKALYPMPE